MAFVNEKLGEKEEAISNYNRAISFNNSFGRAYYRRALVKIQLGNLENGCLDLNRAVELGYKQAEKAITKYCNK